MRGRAHMSCNKVLRGRKRKDDHVHAEMQFKERKG